MFWNIFRKKKTQQKIEEALEKLEPVQPVQNVPPVSLVQNNELKNSKCFERFNDREAAELLAGRCPDCGSKEFYKGPSGGMFTNWTCAGIECGSRFNVCELGGSVMGERISDPMFLIDLDILYKRRC